MIFQQGDVIIEKVSQVKGKKLNHLILAEGESTGHAHRAKEGEIYEDKGTLYLRTTKETDITHEEHKTITLPKGDYKIGIVREYDHFAEEARRVAD